jgi:hypothetical protein
MQNARTLVIAAAALAAAVPAAAQEVLPTPSRGVWLESTYTDFEGEGVKFPTTVWYLGARFPLTQQINAVVDLPFSHSRVEIGDEDAETSSVFGNPYLGVEFAASPSLKLELGTRAPLTNSDDESTADVVAAVSNPLRLEAWAQDVVPLTAGATFSTDLSPAFTLRTRGAATAFFFTGEGDSDTETAIDYSVTGTYTSGNARFGGGFLGRWLASADEGSFGENSLNQLAVSADVLVGNVRPGLSVRVPLDEDYRDVVNSSVALTLQVPLN